MSKQELITEILENIDRQLLLVEGERKAGKRKEIIDNILYEQIEKLKQLLKI